MNTIPDSYFYNKISLQISRCDTAEKENRSCHVTFYSFRKVLQVMLIVQLDQAMPKKH